MDQNFLSFKPHHRKKFMNGGLLRTACHTAQTTESVGQLTGGWKRIKIDPIRYFLHGFMCKLMKLGELVPSAGQFWPPTG